MTSSPWCCGYHHSPSSHSELTAFKEKSMIGRIAYQHVEFYMWKLEMRTYVPLH